MACGGQRRLTGNGSALEVVLHDYALYKSTFTLHVLYFTAPLFYGSELDKSWSGCCVDLARAAERLCDIGYWMRLSAHLKCYIFCAVPLRFPTLLCKTLTLEILKDGMVVYCVSSTSLMWHIVALVSLYSFIAIRHVSPHPCHSFHLRRILQALLLHTTYVLHTKAWERRRRCKENHGEKNCHDAITFN